MCPFCPKKLIPIKSVKQSCNFTIPLSTIQYHHLLVFKITCFQHTSLHNSISRFMPFSNTSISIFIIMCEVMTVPNLTICIMTRTKWSYFIINKVIKLGIRYVRIFNEKNLQYVYINLVFIVVNILQQSFADTEEVIRSISWKDRQYNG